MTAGDPFDPVHTLQKGFRGVLEAVSYPGRLVDVSKAAQAMVGRVGDPRVVPALALGAAALVDQDVDYAVAGTSGLGAFLVEWSSSRPVSAGEAGLVVLDEFGDAVLAALLDVVPVGTLTDPHLGATVLVGVGDLGSGDPWTLSGPGIEAPLRCTLPAGSLWPEVREQRNAEFPLGFDLVFFDRRGRVLGLPRTTRLVGPAAGNGA